MADIQTVWNALTRPGDDTRITLSESLAMFRQRSDAERPTMTAAIHRIAHDDPQVRRFLCDVFFVAARTKASCRRRCGTRGNDWTCCYRPKRTWTKPLLSVC